MRLALGLLALGFFAVGVIADFEDDIAGYMALYFFLGYRHEHAARSGNTTIGGKDCRGDNLCSFQDFLDATTKSQGGYRGNATPSISGTDSAKRSSDRLRNDGMTKAIEWDKKKLISGAPDDKEVLSDYLLYVMNAFSVDKGKGDAQQEHFDLALDALSNMNEINAGYLSTDHTRWWMTLGAPPSGVEFNLIELPADGDTTESEGRTVIDIVNMAKTWAWEVANDIRKRPVLEIPPNSITFKDHTIGQRMAAVKVAFQMCRRGRAYPPGSDSLPPYVPPWG